MAKISKKLTTYIFHSNTIFIQLCVFTVVVSIVPMMIMSSLSFGKISHLVEETLNKSYVQLVAEYMSNMNERFFRYGDRLQQIADNTIVIDELLNRGTSTNPYIKGDKVTTEVGRCLRSEGYSEIKNCMIYSSVDHAKIYGSKVTMMEEAFRENWFANNNALTEGVFSYTASGSKTSVLSLLKDIYYIDTKSFEKQYLGFVKLDLNTAKLFEPIKDRVEGGRYYHIVVLDGQDDIIYCSDEGLLEQVGQVDFERLSSNSMLMQDHKMIYGDEIEPYGLKMMFFFENDGFVKEQEALKKFMSPIVLTLIGMIALMAYLFTRSFSKRVQCLVDKIKQVEEGRFVVTEEITGSDEIAILDRQFNRMIKRLDTLIKKNYIQQLEKKEAELRHLQLQINPHFLYNTLETISSMAAIKQMFDICDICEKLGDIFRYSLGKNCGEYVTVEQELRHTQNYIAIQKARFRDKFHVTYEVDPDLMTRQMLRFILQPIVENAIVHGLSAKAKEGKLNIVIKRDQQDLLIMIKDNGIGMSPERIEELSVYINDDEINLKHKIKSIGVKNVNQRIQLACGSRYGITMQSEQGRGSCFVIRLPFVQ
ncbi:MAG: sensor histidine kinase [Cellulosilyticaceae bacterium]